MIITNYRCYISQEGEKGLKQFKYKGGSDSILYQYLWGPLAEWLVNNVIPVWMAPNVITLIGFAFIIVSSLTLTYYSPDLSQDVPPWTLYFTAFSVLIYQILDNVDGKQARKTGTSSPMGMLCDHGCDSFSSWMLGIAQLICFKAGSNKLSMMTLLMVCMVSFYMGMRAQYFAGTFRLSYINGVDEGLVLIEFWFLISGILGQQIWEYEVVSGYRLNVLTLYLTLILACWQCITFFRDSLKGQKYSTLQTLPSLFCAAVLISVISAICYLSPGNIIETHQYMIIWTFGHLWSKITAHIQIAHLTGEEFNQWRVSFLSVSSLYLLNILYGVWLNDGVTPIEEIIVVWVGLIFSFLSYWHMIVCVFLQMSEVLDIKIFTIPYESKQSNGKKEYQIM